MKGYILTLCASALFVSVSSIILPEGNIKKYASLVSSVMISLSIVAPLKNLFNVNEFISFENIEESYMQKEEAEYIYQNAIKEEYKKTIEEYLSSYGRVYVNVDDDLSVSLIEIYVNVPLSEEDEKKIKEEFNPEKLEVKYGDY